MGGSIHPPDVDQKKYQGPARENKGLQQSRDSNRRLVDVSSGISCLMAAETSSKIAKGGNKVQQRARVLFKVLADLVFQPPPSGK